jgi:DNA primase
MNTIQIKSIKITDYLYNKGIQPKQIKGTDYWYISPYRKEKTPSFKVNNDLNLWYDYGTGQGGNIIDLIMRIYNLNSVTEVLNHFNNSNYQQNIIPQKQTDSFSFDQQKESASTGITILKVLPLTNRALLEYLIDRRINLDIAKKNCKEIYYSVGDKRYFAIGFQNESGGYELRNKYFKGCTSKDISVFKPNSNNTEACLVFEGFMDYLSYLTIKKINKPIVDTVILNSVSNLSKAIGFIQSHPKVYTYLDNDEAGKTTTELLNKTCYALIDKSVKYADHKDLNEYLCNTQPKQNIQQAMRINKSKGI